MFVKFVPGSRASGIPVLLRVHPPRPRLHALQSALCQRHGKQSTWYVAVHITIILTRCVSVIHTICLGKGVFLFYRAFHCSASLLMITLLPMLMLWDSSLLLALTCAHAQARYCMHHGRWKAPHWCILVTCHSCCWSFMCVCHVGSSSVCHHTGSSSVCHNPC